MPAFVNFLSEESAWESALLLMDMSKASVTHYELYKNYVPDSSPFAMNVGYLNRKALQDKLEDAIRDSSDSRLPKHERKEAQEYLASNDRTDFHDCKLEIMQMIRTVWSRFAATGKTSVFSSLVTRRR